jgi:two-component system response regulator HydG
MKKTAHLLIVDDEKNIREGLKQFLLPRGYDVSAAGDAASALAAMRSGDPDVVLLDMRLPDRDGLDLLEQIKKLSPDTVVLVFTAYGSTESALAAGKRGADDYLQKPLDFNELEFRLAKALKSRESEQEKRELRWEKLELKSELWREKWQGGAIVAQSKPMSDLLNLVDRVAPSPSSVLIQGESGTGKEMIAHLIHGKSPRKDRSFVTVHCAALTETLLSSELFGHEKGAFTGASERKIGRFERAHTGTLFLDEVAEIKADMQVKLLRVLQNGEFERVGGTRTLRADVRLISATNKNLGEAVRLGPFREDLYYRIKVITIDMPPLRERKTDIEPLVRHFLTYFAEINHKKVQAMEPAALRQLEEYRWPGNVRELKNVVERMVVLASPSTEMLSLEHIPLDVRESPESILGGSVVGTEQSAGFSGYSSFRVRDMERQLIEHTLREVKGNKLKAAKLLGMSRRTLYRKLDEYEITYEQ